MLSILLLELVTLSNANVVLFVPFYVLHLKSYYFIYWKHSGLGVTVFVLFSGFLEILCTVHNTCLLQSNSVGYPSISQALRLSILIRKCTMFVAKE